MLKIPRISKPGLPMSSYEDLTAFKIYMSDVGLLRRHSRLAHSAFPENTRLFTEFKGALTENYILQSITRRFETIPYYLTNSTHEVDFIIQNANAIIPVEVKARQCITSPSLKAYITHYDEQTPLAVRFSLQNLSLDGRILNVPLYMAEEIKRLIEAVKDVRN